MREVPGLAPRRKYSRAHFCECPRDDVRGMRALVNALLTKERSAAPQIDLPFEAAPPSIAVSTLGQRHLVTGLFSGIGGLEVGLSRQGHRAELMCENDAPATAVLNAHFPKTHLHGDIRELDEIPSATTLLTAGFPCQDLSQAGTTSGILGSRSGLVGEVFRLVEKHKTPWILLENVPFMLQLGRGAAMEILASTFEKLGYRWAYRIVDARSFGLPQRRRRVYMLASNVGDPREVLFADEAGPVESYFESRLDAVACGFYWTEGIRGLGWAVDSIPTLKGGSGLGIPSPPAILLPSGAVVLIDVRDAERLQGFPVDWTEPAEAVAKRGSRWKLIGNAVSVPAAEWLGQRLANPKAVLALNTKPHHRGSQWPTAAWNVGDGRVSVSISEWPVYVQPKPLEAFLQFDTRSLSYRATSGFLARTSRASLRFPEGFIESIKAHLARSEPLPSDANQHRLKSKRGEAATHGSEKDARALPVRQNNRIVEDRRQIREPLAVP